MLKIQLKVLQDFLAHLSKRERTVFYGAVFFVSMALLDRLIIHPITSRIQFFNEAIEQKESDIRKSLRIISQKDRILQESQRYATFMIRSRSDEEEISSLLKEIENLASEAEVYLVDLKPREPRDMGAYKKYIISLNCEAQMEQIAYFIYNIENSNKLMAIERYQIGPKSKGSSIAKCSMVISKIGIPQQR